MSKEFIEREQGPSVDQENVRETQQPWWRRPKEEANSSYNELGHGNGHMTLSLNDLFRSTKEEFVQVCHCLCI